MYLSGDPSPPLVLSFLFFPCSSVVWSHGGCAAGSCGGSLFCSSERAGEEHVISLRTVEPQNGEGNLLVISLFPLHICHSHRGCCEQSRQPTIPAHVLLFVSLVLYITSITSSSSRYCTQSFTEYTYIRASGGRNGLRGDSPRTGTVGVARQYSETFLLYVARYKKHPHHRTVL